MKPWQKLTDMMAPGVVADEMVKKYRGTVLGITEESRDTIAYGWYQGLSIDGQFHILKTDLGSRFQVAVDTDYNVFIPDPERGMYNTSGGVVYFYRKPFRQHKRGLGDGTAMCIRLASTILPEIGGNYLENYVMDILNEFDSGRSYSLKNPETWDLIDNKGELALNRTYVVTLHAHKEQGYELYYEHHLIGDITKDGKILLGNPVLYQEIMDTKHTWAPNFSVEIM